MLKHPKNKIVGNCQRVTNKQSFETDISTRHFSVLSIGEKKTYVHY